MSANLFGNHQKKKISNSILSIRKTLYDFQCTPRGTSTALKGLCRIKHENTTGTLNDVKNVAFGNPFQNKKLRNDLTSTRLHTRCRTGNVLLVIR